MNTHETSPRGRSQDFRLVGADGWRVWMLRLGRKKEERTKQRRGAAVGADARLFVADHGDES